MCMLQFPSKVRFVGLSKSDYVSVGRGIRSAKKSRNPLNRQTEDTRCKPYWRSLQYSEALSSGGSLLPLPKNSTPAHSLQTSSCHIFGLTSFPNVYFCIVLGTGLNWWFFYSTVAVLMCRERLRPAISSVRYRVMQWRFNWSLVSMQNSRPPTSIRRIAYVVLISPTESTSQVSLCVNVTRWRNYSVTLNIQSDIVL